MMAAAHTHAPPAQKGATHACRLAQRTAARRSAVTRLSCAPRRRDQSKEPADSQARAVAVGVGGCGWGVLEESGGWLLLLVLGRGRGTRGVQGRGHLQWWWTLLAVDGTATTAPLPFPRHLPLPHRHPAPIACISQPSLPLPPTHYPHGMHTPFPTWPPTPLVSEPACWHSRQV